eukprot:GILK01008369.1.p1 GENE.GILK01008369.1~~GILK01008369.1.p1  ORF type:complete len:583 (+),score=127.39 GILK01008369.1:33-1751(+)
MATGDIGNNIEKLRVELRQIRYPGEVDSTGLAEGRPTAILPILHWIWLGFSRFVARSVNEKGYELYTKSDTRFLEGVYKLLRTEYHYNPSLTTAQFLSQGFSERKVLFCIDVIRIAKKVHNELFRQHKDQSQKFRPRTPSRFLETQVVNELTGSRTISQRPSTASAVRSDSHRDSISASSLSHNNNNNHISHSSRPQTARLSSSRHELSMGSPTADADDEEEVDDSGEVRMSHERLLERETRPLSSGIIAWEREPMDIDDREGHARPPTRPTSNHPRHTLTTSSSAAAAVEDHFRVSASDSTRNSIDVPLSHRTSTADSPDVMFARRPLNPVARQFEEEDQEVASAGHMKRPSFNATAGNGESVSLQASGQNQIQNRTVDIMKSIQEQLSSLIGRFDRFESRVDSNLDKVNAQIILLEGRLKFVEHRLEDSTSKPVATTETVRASPPKPSTVATPLQTVSSSTRYSSVTPSSYHTTPSPVEPLSAVMDSHNVRPMGTAAGLTGATGSGVSVTSSRRTLPTENATDDVIAKVQSRFEETKALLARLRTPITERDGRDVLHNDKGTTGSGSQRR